MIKQIPLLANRANRKNRCESSFDDGGGTAFLVTPCDVCSRIDWVCHAYCLMTNHCHFLVETVNDKFYQDAPIKWLE